MKPNMLVRKSEQGQATKKKYFFHKKKIELCISLICVTFSNFVEDQCFASKNTSLYFGKASIVYKTLKVLGCNCKIFEKTYESSFGID